MCASHYRAPTHGRGVTRAREEECVALNGFSRLNLSRAFSRYTTGIGAYLIPWLTSTNIGARGIVDINNGNRHTSDRRNNGARRHRDAVCSCPSDDGGSLEVMKIDRVAGDNTTRQSDLTVN